MESARPYVFLKDNFEVTLSKTDTELKIEAKEQGTGFLYLEEISIGAIKTITNDLFENIPEFFEALLTAFGGQSDEAMIRIDQEAKLHFTQKLKFGKSDKVANLTIPLKELEEKEEEEDLSGSVDELLKRLFKEVKGLKKENRALKKENQAIKKEVQQLQEKLGCSSFEVMTPNFDIEGLNAWKYFEVKGKRIIRNNNENQIYQISSTEKISKSKNTKLRVRIDKLDRTIAIGVALKSLLSNRYWFNEDGAYSFVSRDEVRCNRYGIHWINYSSMTAGSIIEMLFIPRKNEIEFEINGRLVYTAKMKPEHQMLDFYPVVSLTSCDDCVTFLGRDEVEVEGTITGTPGMTIKN